MFTYCDNNPVSNIDPNGHAKVTIIIKKDFLRDALTSSLCALGTIIGAALFSFTGAGAVIAGAIGAALGWTFGGSISKKFITKDVTLKLWLPFVKAGTYIVY